jgi:3-oxoacyl-[acyl-carrier-protein] synthase II
LGSNRSRHAVAITGLGPLTSIGRGVAEFWDGVLSGRSGAVTVSFDWVESRSFKSRVGAPVADPDLAGSNLSEREADLLDPASRYALVAAAMAIRDAGLSVSVEGDRRSQVRIDGLDPERGGVILGTGIGGLCTLEESHRKWVRGEPITGAYRHSLPMLIPNALPAQVAIKYGLHGECKAVVTACASGTMAIGDAYRLIRDGELDFALAGGVDKTLSDVDGYGLLGFDLLRTLSTRNGEPERASRPFDRERDGFVLGEGAGILVLERLDHARARGGRVYAEVAGYATTCDAYSMMQLEPGGEQMARVMERAIGSAEIEAADVGYVNAHGTATRQNDSQEARALHRVFGRRIYDVLVNSTKAMTGHAIGASGGIEAITTALSLARGVVHRCVNLEMPDPECDLALPRENREARPAAALSNSFAFGGHNATLVLKAV